MSNNKQDISQLITLYDGKYAVKNNNGILEIYRNGQRWGIQERSLIGNGFVLSLVQEIERLKEQSNDIFVIEAVEIDSMENNVCRAITHDIVGFVDNESVAKSICDNSGYYTSEDCWAIGEKLQKMRYKKVKQFVRS